MYQKMCFLLILLSLPLLTLAQSIDKQAYSYNRETIVRPHFRGDLGKYLASSVQYPKVAAEKGIQGKCVIEFTVDEQGYIKHVENAQSSGDALLDEEALRVVANMPKWRPGSWNERPARYSYSLPVKFELE